MQSKEAHKQLLTKSLDTAVDSVKTFKQELQTLLDEIENDTIVELKKHFERIEKSLAEEIEFAENEIDALNKMAIQLRTMEGNKVQEFVCVKTFEKMTKRRETEMNKQQSQSDETVSFDTDQSIKSFLKNMKVFGKITCQISSVPNTRLAVKTQPNTHTATRPKDTLYKVTKQRNVVIRLPDDDIHCHIQGSCITDGGFLLLVDTNNNKLKRLNMTTKKVKDYLSLISSPNAVCQVRKTEAAVSLNNNSIRFVTLGDKLTATRTLTLKHECWGLAYSNGKLFMSDNGNSVYIHDIKGKELLKITTDSSGKDILNTSHIAISADGSRVFVANFEEGLITLDIKGKYLSTLSNSEIKASCCSGVCIDGSYVWLHVEQCCSDRTGSQAGRTDRSRFI